MKTMLDNIEYREISKNKVLGSVLFLPLVCFTVMFLIGVWFSFTGSNPIDAVDIVQNLIFNPLYILLMTTFVWIPILVLQLMLELFVVNANSSMDKVNMMILFETMILVGGLIIIFHDIEINVLTSCMLVLIVSQLIRWIYIKKKGVN
jgi:hypothetical protein